MPKTKTEIKLTIVLTVVSGKESVRRCLSALYRQVNFDEAEIIIPFDTWSLSVGELKEEFPKAVFHFIEDLGIAADPRISSHQHRLYDRRRAIGLMLSSGRIIAMTEDHAVPAHDWCVQIQKLHDKAFDAIGGAIENGVDSPLNWALYYCDFGRYGKPLPSGEADYVSDINISYKKEALTAVKDSWQEAYHETTVHQALRARGSKLYLDERMVVYQYRPSISFFSVLRERVEWGRIFAETRTSRLNPIKRLPFIAGSILLLPPLLSARAIKNMRRQKRPLRQTAVVLPLVFLLSVGWALGEFIGYVNGEPKTNITDDRPAEPTGTVQTKIIG